MAIEPTPFINDSHRTGYIPGQFQSYEITKILGFKPNVDDGRASTKRAWHFKVDNCECAIWEYRLSWCIHDPHNKFPFLLYEYEVERARNRFNNFLEMKKRWQK